MLIVLRKMLKMPEEDNSDVLNSENGTLPNLPAWDENSISNWIDIEDADEVRDLFQ